MGTTAEKLYKILDSKEEIKQALIAKGINITDETTFAEYAEKINEITNGGAITDEEALLFIKDLAEGKRKIANAVKNKYEGTKGEASGITEYSTFDELSDKIADIPITVPMGNAMEQNGGVLPFYDVYNEALKAWDTFGGRGFKGCCAFELDKWSYDNDDKVTLSGADAYYTSDGTFIKDNIIYKNGSQIGELDNSLYQFQDQDAENTNRFVVYFFGSTPYQVPKSLPATSVFGLWCLKGTPLMNFGAEYTRLLTVKVYDGSLDVADDNDCNLKTPALRFVNLPHIKKVLGGTGIYNYNNMNITSMGLDNLTHLEAKSNLIGQGPAIRNLELPNLEYVMVYANVYLFNRVENINTLRLPKLKEIRHKSWSQSALIYYSHNISLIELPALEICEKIIMPVSLKQGCKLVLGNPKNGDIDITHSSTNTYLESITVEKGFASKLNIKGCNSLSREVIVDILNNLEDLTGETSLNLIMGSTLLAKLTDADKAIATQKNWSLS